MNEDLPTALLRSLVAVAETGSLGRAAARLSRSESAISLQMSRLEAIAGTRLFNRDGRTLKLNQSGSLLLGHARAILARIDAARAHLRSAGREGPVRAGLVQDFAGAPLEAALRLFRHSHGQAQVEIVVAGTAELLMSMSEQQLDLALCARAPLTGKALAVLPMQWFGDPGLLDADVLPLVAINAPCPFLSAATTALDGMGRPYRIALSTPSLDGVRAATRAGMGLACRTAASMAMAALAGAVVDGRLPALPSVTYDLIARPDLGPAAHALQALLQQQVQALAQTPAKPRPTPRRTGVKAPVPAARPPARAGAAASPPPPAAPGRRAGPRG